ncbi:hypothetical protein F4055_01595, partial [Candidatus Poribacteria bacterium]|nr:hypothetical protein [Candidatus Poribacteria bacterium]
MKNLMKRKVVLGVLMTLVLGFGVQGVADALRTLSESGLPVDLTTQNIATPFTLTLTATPDRVNNKESVTVSVSRATFLFEGTPRTSYTFYEADSDVNTAGFQDGDLTVPALPITVTSAGKVTVTITGTASADSTSHRIVRTYYAPQATVPASVSIRLAGISNGISTGYYSGPQLVYGGSGNYPVTYTVTGGQLQIVEGNRMAAAAASVTTSTAARIVLQNRTTTATVTAMVGSSTVTGVYIYGHPTLSTDVTVADDASDGTAVPGERIPDAFTVTVMDGASTPAGIDGVPVKFDVKDKSVSGGELRPGDSTIVDASNRGVTNALPSKTLYVQTASGGTAAIDYEVGDAGRRQAVTVSAVGQTREAFAITNASPDRKLSVHSSVRISGTTNKYTLIVLLQDDGDARSGVTVTFNVLKGELTNRPADGSTPSAGMQVTQVTDERGRAHVTYDTRGITGVLEVVVSVHKTADTIAGGTAETDKISLVFNVSGGSVTPTTNQQQQQQGTGRNVLSFNLGTSISGNTGDEINLQATARDQDGFTVPQVPVTFTISDSDVGTLSTTSLNTNSNGVAGITLTLGEEDGSITASASGYDSATATITITPAPAGLQVASGDNQDGEPGSVLSSAFVVRFEDTEGNPISGAEVTFTVETGGGSLSSSTDTTDSDGEAETTLTLGTQGMRNTVRARVDSTAYPNVGSAVFTAEATRGPEAIVVVDGDDQIGQVGRLLDEDLSVQVVDSDDSGVSGVLVRFRVTEGRGRLSRNSDRTDPDGYAEVGFTPTADGEAVVEAYSTGLTSAFFTINTGEPPDAITIVSGNNQNGRPGARLANPLVVEVIDENDDPVSGVTVSFSVTAGGGSVSPTSATTNSSGRAQTRLTLGDDPGENTVRASVAGVSPVSFKATSGMQVHLNASQRPPMYWISKADGTLYRLVDDAIESLAPNVTGITNIAVDAANNVLYLSVQTGENRGEIRRANLNGGNVRTLKTLTAVPRGITVDSTGDTLYWANSRGRIQSMPTAGSTKLTNVLENLRNPTIVVSNGHLYWTESIGRIRRISLTDAQQTIQNIATGLGEPLGLSIAKGKVYWIERDADGSGSLNRSNLDGSNVQALKTFASGVPTSLAVDSGDNKIYWTKGAGKIQRSNLAGKFVRDVASGVMNPTGIALSVAATDGQMATTQPGTRNTEQANNAQSTYSRYDINRDGAVNNADTRAVAAAIGQSGADIANPRTDVDGNGMVDVTDLILVLGNLDDDVAAPTLAIDVKALDIDFDRVQEQVEVLLASGDASIAAQRALLYLQHLLASARPDETVLLANYPNPFNPETWIPYHLSESADVKINIYDAQGVLVRALTV